MVSVSAALDSDPTKRLAPDSESPALRCSGLVKRFGKVEAVCKLDLEVHAGQILSLLGPSGCGKTTALRLIAGFECPDEGEISIDGDVVSSAASFVPPEKRHIGMVFQEGALFPHLTVEDNVGYGLRKDSDRPGRVAEALELVGLAEMRRRMPFELSGGQQQRVALARALAPKPDILLMDEPFSNLDAKLRDQLQRDVVDILHANGVTTVFVTHDQQSALAVGDEVAVMNEGRLEQAGSASSVFHYPETKFVAQFIGDVDFIPVSLDGGRLVSELGSFNGISAADSCLHGAAPHRATEVDSIVVGNRVLELMLRPDCLECYEDEGSGAVVVGREFHGAFYLYRVRLPSGHEVRCLLPHIAEFPVGSAVSVRMRQGHQGRLFADDRLVA